MPTAELELGYLARPDGSDGAAAPGMVMIPDVWGLSDHTRDLARRLAGEGFAVLALDLYRREPEVAIRDPGRWIRGLSDPQVLGDVQAAIDLLAGDAARGHDVGVTGFCMGGMYAILAAAGCHGLAAAVPFYGMLSDQHGLLAPGPGEPRDPARKPRSALAAGAAVRCPMLAFFGEDDAFIPVADVRAFERALARSGQPHEVVLYEGAGHAFMNDTRPEMYRPEVARRAWQRMLGWLRARLH